MEEGERNFFQSASIYRQGFKRSILQYIQEQTLISSPSSYRPVNDSVNCKYHTYEHQNLKPQFVEPPAHSASVPITHADSSSEVLQNSRRRDQGYEERQEHGKEGKWREGAAQRAHAK